MELEQGLDPEKRQKPVYQLEPSSNNDATRIRKEIHMKLPLLDSLLRIRKRHSCLFCVQNAGRSQMAEGLQKVTPKGLETISVRTLSSSQINPVAVEAMKEVGIDISKQKPKDLTEDMMRIQQL